MFDLHVPLAIIGFGLPTTALGITARLLWQRKLASAPFALAATAATVVAVMDGDSLVRYFLNMGKLDSAFYMAMVMVISATLTAGAIVAATSRKSRVRLLPARRGAALRTK